MVDVVEVIGKNVKKVVTTGLNREPILNNVKRGKL